LGLCLQLTKLAQGLKLAKLCMELTQLAERPQLAELLLQLAQLAELLQLSQLTQVGHGEQVSQGEHWRHSRKPLVDQRRDGGA
jgi:hypothetical protein